eukprot:COSAG01_NODE_10695_length_2103_cov_1.735529_2_plen_167_part_01
MRTPALIVVPQLVQIMRNTAVTGTIDPLVNLRKSSVLLVSGANDTVVQQGVVRSLRTLLQSFLPNESIHTEFTLPAEHAWLTDSFGSACGHLGTPFINNCGFNLARRSLQLTLPGGLPHEAAEFNASNLLQFGQAEFALPAITPSVIGLDRIGYVYIPTLCRQVSGG